MTSEVRYLRWDGKQLDHLKESKPFMRYVVLSALTCVAEAMREAGWDDVVSPTEVVDYALEEVFLLQTPSGWIGFGVDQPWFLSDKVLFEEFITPGVPLDEVLDALTAAAKRFRVGRITLGTRALGSRQAAAQRRYEQLGCQVSTVEITKRIAL